MPNTTKKMIQPAIVQRDEYGAWTHPDLPTFEGDDEAPEGAPKWSDWRKAQGLEESISSLEDEDDNHPVYQSYFEQADPDPNFSAWNPTPPKGDGWFLLAIDATEDGPFAWFVRRAAAIAEQQQHQGGSNA